MFCSVKDETFLHFPIDPHLKLYILVFFCGSKSIAGKYCIAVMHLIKFRQTKVVDQSGYRLIIAYMVCLNSSLPSRGSTSKLPDNKCFIYYNHFSILEFFYLLLRSDTIYPEIGLNIGFGYRFLNPIVFLGRP